MEETAIGVEAAPPEKKRRKKATPEGVVTPKKTRAKKTEEAKPVPTDLALLDSCEQCPALVMERMNGSVNPVRIMGPKTARVILVADNPQIGEAFHGAPDWERDDWQVVVDALSSAEFTFEEVAVAYATRCAVGRVGDKAKLLKSEVISNCRPWFHLELAEYPNVQAIMCLGRVATSAVLGCSLLNYAKSRGKIHEVSLAGRSIRVVVSSHPFQVLSSPFEKEAFEMDFRQLRAAAEPDYAPFDMARHQETHTEKYHLVDSVGELQAMVDRLLEVPMVAFDTETRGLDPFHLPTPDPADAGLPLKFLTTIQFSPTAGESYFVPVCHKDFNIWTGSELTQWLETLRFFFENYRGTLVGYNGKFDQVAILHDLGVLPRLSMDPMIVDQLRRGMPARSLKKLAWLVSNYGGYETQLKSSAPAGHEHDSYYYPLEELFWYGCLDTDVTYRAAEKFAPILAADGKLKTLSDFLAAASGVLAEVAVDGWRIDLKYLEEYGATQLKTVAGAKATIRSVAAEAVAAFEKQYGKEFDPSSAKSLGFLLFDLLGLPSVEKTDKGAPSTAKGALSAIETHHPVVPLILNMRKADKAYSAFYKRWKEGVGPDGRLHFHYNLIKFRDLESGEKGGTETGRLSSSGAAGNAQQITKDPVIRKTFLPDRPGDVLVDIDFSTLEYVIAAVYSKDEKLCSAFRKGYDIHAAVAAEMFDSTPEEMSKPENKKLRSKGKTMNFSALYGAGPENVADQLKCSKEEAEEFLENYYAKFPGLVKWIAATKRAVRKSGRATSKMGRFRALPDAMLPDTKANKGRIEAALRQAVNGPIQGDASDVCLWGLVRVADLIRELKLQTRIKATIHDAIILSCPPEEVFEVIDAVCHILTNPGLEWLDGPKGPGVPLRVSVEIGETWGDMVSYEED